jgi:hydrogenase maturation protease
MEAGSLDVLREGNGPVCWVGVGNTGLGDDGFGVRLAEALSRDGHPHVVTAGTAPERWVETVAAGGFSHVVFLDAADGPGEPGTAFFLDAEGIEARYPQVSTHRISLGTLARLIAERGPRVWMLGVKPASLGPGSRLSEPVRHSLGLLKDLLGERLGVART